VEIGRSAWGNYFDLDIGIGNGSEELYVSKMSGQGFDT